MCNLKKKKAICCNYNFLYNIYTYGAQWESTLIPSNEDSCNDVANEVSLLGWLVVTQNANFIQLHGPWGLTSLANVNSIECYGPFQMFGFLKVSKMTIWFSTFYSLRKGQRNWLWQLELKMTRDNLGC